MRPLPFYWLPEAPGDIRVPVARPRLPRTDEIIPYLRRIDASGWYSNGGPLVQEFETRLAAHAGGGEARAATIANATVGLMLSLRACDVRPGLLCMVPAWTFAATGHAVLLAGLTPWIVDVDPGTWALEPAAARARLEDAPGEVAAVIPVSPFGAPLDPGPWEIFRDKTGIAVVLDAAAAFDSVRASSLPAVVSLHATKVLGIGEGGFVVSTDANLIEEVQKRANFGFWNSREATTTSTNGKISEYAAAVGLAALDDWGTARADFARVAQVYRRTLGEDDELILPPGLGDAWVSSTMVLQSRAQTADRLAEKLAAGRIGTRRWWGGGLHRHRAFANFPRSETDETETLVRLTIGLPCWRDLPDAEIALICEHLTG